VIGSVLLVRAGALETVGGFDERFFLYAEETDWQRRAVAAGWSVRECEDVVALHAGAGTGGDPRRREIYFHASHERYVRKHYGAAGWWAYRAAAVSGAAARAVCGGSGARAAARLRLGLYLRGPVRVQDRLPQPGVAS
jgi:GT2 family glycosyltransferase